MILVRGQEVGNVLVRSKDGPIKTIHNVLLVRGLGLNLFFSPISLATKRGIKVNFTEDTLKIIRNNVAVLGEDRVSSKQYQFTFEPIISSSYNTVAQSSTDDRLVTCTDRVRNREQPTHHSD